MFLFSVPEKHFSKATSLLSSGSPNTLLKWAYYQLMFFRVWVRQGMKYKISCLPHSLLSKSLPFSPYHEKMWKWPRMWLVFGKVHTRGICRLDSESLNSQTRFLHSGNGLCCDQRKIWIWGKWGYIYFDAHCSFLLPSKSILFSIDIQNAQSTPECPAFLKTVVQAYNALPSALRPWW